MLLHFDLTAGHGIDQLRYFAELGRAIAASDKTELVLEVVLAAKSSVCDELATVAALVADAGLKLSGILVSPAVDRKSTIPGTPWPPCPPLSEIYQAARQAFPGLLLGGGSLAYFTELNRKRPPIELLDFVSHCTCPIVHAADDRTVMESLESLPHITRSTRAIIGNSKGYRIGPSTIAMRHNPYGERVKPNPANGRVPMTDRDPRQTSLFAAAWMVGYVAATAEAGLQTLTVAGLTGPQGLAEADLSGEPVLHPAFYAACGLAGLGGNQRYHCQSSRPDLVASVAGIDQEGRRSIWLANLTGQPQEVLLEGAGDVTSATLLDEESLAAEALEPWRETPVAGGELLQLLPYAVACLRGTVP